MTSFIPMGAIKPPDALLALIGPKQHLRLLPIRSIDPRHG
jgi:hypothetical protein